MRLVIGAKAIAEALKPIYRESEVDATEQDLATITNRYGAKFGTLAGIDGSLRQA